MVEHFEIQQAADRIGQMERYFDLLQKAANTDPAAFRESALLEELLRILKEYYESGQWLRDYELDEQGLLPQSLKRGVLAQDAVYDFFDRIKDFERSDH